MNYQFRLVFNLLESEEYYLSNLKRWPQDKQSLRPEHKSPEVGSFCIRNQESVLEFAKTFLPHFENLEGLFEHVRIENLTRNADGKTKISIFFYTNPFYAVVTHAQTNSILCSPYKDRPSQMVQFSLNYDNINVFAEQEYYE